MIFLEKYFLIFNKQLNKKKIEVCKVANLASPLFCSFLSNHWDTRLVICYLSTCKIESIDSENAIKEKRIFFEKWKEFSKIFQLHSTLVVLLNFQIQILSEHAWRHVGILPTNEVTAQNRRVGKMQTNFFYRWSPDTSVQVKQNQSGHKSIAIF